MANFSLKKVTKIGIGLGVMGFIFSLYILRGTNPIEATADAATSKPLPKYQRALVLQGGGMGFAVQLGMLEGVRSEGYNPDIIVGSCGGSIPAAIAQMIPDSADQKKFIESETVYNALSSIHLNDHRHLFVALGLFSEVLVDGYTKRIPRFFDQYLMDVPAQLPLNVIQNNFQTPSATTPAVMIVAGQMQYGPNDEGKPMIRGNSVHETYFTDPYTAQLLQGSSSPIGGEFPESWISTQTEIITDATLGQAVRGSISDPYYIRPGQVGDHYYITGGEDLFPIEAAYELAEQVAMPFADTFADPIDLRVFLNAFGFSQIDRLRHVTAQYADYWIDSSDDMTVLKGRDLNPKLDLSDMGIVEGIPQDYKTYVQNIEFLWQYGFERGSEAIRLPKNDKTHIRNKTKTNFAGQ